ncbi:ATP-dependent RNA helicase DBP7 [Pleurostoma richardsiae]|uniref:ATP-dependent RNA helicase n=1 Tax=Pleurostoma richardsiae TaxID=41990 RepID=A0AA38R9R6_9PEZI|nr:ATP-dependent RNA helicase DBP7 [Pleurostoma richardsiae]
MADDGMLLNFEIGDAPIKTQVKFKGGRWRDRVRAQKSVKRVGEQTVPGGTPPHRQDSTRDDGGFADSGRPSKRPRIDFSGQRGRDGGGRSGESRPHSTPSQGITSRLFSSNPTPTTVIEDQAPEESEPSKPSNAPLTEEAANFHALGLSPRISQHLSSKLEMKAPTSIQKNTIPKLVAEDSDAFLQAETGSGKTLAYLLPIVQRIMALSVNEDGTSTGTKIHRDSGLFAVILAPTRELCKQIAVVLEKVLRCAPWIVSTQVIGGESKKSEKARLRKGVNILIATPGRLTDHLDNTKVLDVGTVRWLVLDEGDRLMEMGFEDDIKTIVGKIRKEGLREKNKDGVVLGQALPKRRVTVLCSATMKMNVQRLGEISLEDAIHITAARGSDDTTAGEINESVFTAPSQLKQTYLIVPAKLRLVTLISLLKSSFARRGSVMKAIVFISCADSVDFHFELLKSTAPPALPSPESSPSNDKDEKSKSITADTVAPAAYITSPANPSITLHKLHGSLAQPVRTSTLNSFAACKNPSVLITTDISSRGLDVPAVDLVVEYDPAFSVADHVHRVGRTARAGRPGKAVLFLMPGCEEGYVSLLHSSNPLTPQLYDSVLQKGLASPVDLPPSASTDAAPQQPEKQSYSARAEALQLHIEQRILASDQSAGEKSSKDGSKGKGKKGGKSAPPASRPSASSSHTLLNAARQGFRSHVRAYTTHVKEERAYFDISQLHLGHVAKSFGLREAPGGIGGGVQRRAAHGGKARAAGATGSGVGKKRGAAALDSDDEDVGRGAGADEDAARRMREKMKAVMNAAGEFNIG